jgi:hypothetical protein
MRGLVGCVVVLQLASSKDAKNKLISGEDRFTTEAQKLLRLALPLCLCGKFRF